MRKKYFQFVFSKGDPIVVRSRFYCLAKKKAIEQFTLTADLTGITSDVQSSKYLDSLKKAFFTEYFQTCKTYKTDPQINKLYVTSTGRSNS